VAGFGVNASPPEGLSAFSKQVFDIVVKYTVFAWPILTAQCRRANVDPMHLEPGILKQVASFVGEGVAAFTSPGKGKQVEADLMLLARMG
jgi:hypothetical protein